MRIPQSARVVLHRQNARISYLLDERDLPGEVKAVGVAQPGRVGPAVPEVPELLGQSCARYAPGQSAGAHPNWKLPIDQPRRGRQMGMRLNGHLLARSLIDLWTQVDQPFSIPSH